MAIQDPPDRFMTAGEAAVLLRVSTRTVRRLIRRREVPAVRVGGQYRIDTEGLEALLTPATNAKPGVHRGARRAA